MEKFKIETMTIRNGKIKMKTSTVTKEALISTICTERSFEDAFYYLSVLYGQEDDAQFNVVPNIDEAREILNKHKCKFKIFGLWIVLFFEDNPDGNWWEELDSMDLAPYAGYGLRYDDFINNKK